MHSPESRHTEKEGISSDDEPEIQDGICQCAVFQRESADFKYANVSFIISLISEYEHI